MALEVTLGPALEPVTLNEAKDFLRVNGDDDDALISELIVAARRAGEDFTRRTFIATTYKLSLDRWPSRSDLDDGLWEGVREGADKSSPNASLALPRPPLRSVTSVTTFDDTDAGTVWASSNYFVDTGSIPGRILPRSGRAPPTAARVANGIEIVFKAGHGDAAQSVPRPLRQGLLMLVSHLHEQREPVIVGERVSSLPLGVGRLWQPFRVMKL